MIWVVIDGAGLPRSSERKISPSRVKLSASEQVDFTERSVRAS